MFGEMSFCLQWMHLQVSGCPHAHVTNICKDFLLDQTTVEVKPQFVTDGRKGR